jgi:hypothetical protein
MNFGIMLLGITGMLGAVACRSGSVPVEVGKNGGGKLAGKLVAAGKWGETSS